MILHASVDILRSGVRDSNIEDALVLTCSVLTIELACLRGCARPRHKSRRMRDRRCVRAGPPEPPRARPRPPPPAAVAVRGSGRAGTPSERVQSRTRACRMLVATGDLVLLHVVAAVWLQALGEAVAVPSTGVLLAVDPATVPTSTGTTQYSMCRCVPGRAVEYAVHASPR